MFNAAPGATYLAQVVNIYEQLGHNLQQLANNLDDIPVFQSLHPNFQTAAEFAADFLTPLGLQNDSVALSFVIDKFNAGVAKGEIMYEGLLALEGIGSGAASQYVAAKAILENKTAVSEYYSVTKAVDQTDLNTLQLVLNGVTADPASVTAAKTGIDNGTLGTSGIEVTLTPSQDSVVGTTSSDTINGLFGDATASNNTFTAGDSVDGAAGTDRLNLVALGTTASQAVTVKNVESINIQDTVGATFNALLVENTPGIAFNSTLAGQTSTVTNAALASVMGLSGKGNLTVDYSVTSGAADTANVVLNTVGTSTTARSTVNVADGNTVEKVVIAAEGTNFVTLVGGTADANVTVTGAGTNNFDLSAVGAVAAVATIDASASTGTNTFVLGTTLNTGDVVKGGTGADTVSTNFTLATLTKPTMTGVETLTSDFDAAAIVDLSGTTGLTTINLAGSSADQTLTKATSSVATINVTSEADADNVLHFGYGATTMGSLALKLGSTAATAAAITLADVNLDNTTALALSTVGTKAIDINGTIDLNGDQSAVSVTAGANLEYGGIRVDGGDVGSYTKTIASNVVSSGGIWTVGGDIGPVTVTVGANAESYSWIAASGAGDIGDVSITVTGDSSIADQYLDAAGNIGNITYSVTGDDFSGFIAAEASGGSVGNVNITMTGDDSHGHAWISAGTFSGAADVSTIGNISVSVAGDNSTFSGQFNVSGGDVGNVTFAYVGDGGSGSIAVQAGYRYGGDGDDYLGGGSIGNVSFSMDGDSSGYLALAASGGTIGDITISATNGADVDVHVSAGSLSYSGGLENAGSIGNISISVGDDSNVSGSFNASGGDIGNVTVMVTGDNASGTIQIEASSSSGAGSNGDYTHGGNVGNIVLDINGQSTMSLDVFASGGNIGTVSVSVEGNGASAGLSLHSFATDTGSTGGNIGAVSVTLGDSTSIVVSGGFEGTLESLTVVGGDSVSAGFFFSGGSGGMVGDVSIAVGDSSSVAYAVSGFGGDTSNVTITTGNNADVEVLLENFTGTAGATSITTGTNSDVVFSGGNISSIGGLTLAGGDSASTASIHVTGTVNDFGGVAGSTWKGAMTVDLSAVVVGTTVQVGAGGSNVTGTQGSDNIFMGAGVDTYHFAAPGGAADVLFAFKAGAGADVIDVAHVTNFTANTYTTNTADTILNDEAAKLTDIAGGQDLTTAAGVKAALNAGGEYALIDVAANSSSTFITAASATSQQFFVWEVVENTADTEVDTVTLVGVVNTSTAFSALVAANLV
ncbi:beta strand repeat-containing protein [Caenimonas aquaedulcis]|uniref:Uncharacterized protein n=1 Tax=Caenimonas aquaedulcis TaxID=2793270 RepID=A0A931H763_9BURK|nr:hypothetical protein [Caenimonas aquaedulcis]MBG9389788.1 hypothetical protein [Caenimonas aquaedulcis]